jgi:ADP-heptose:LPS heptosyltransferase
MDKTRINKVYIYFINLGIGDLIMLSPFIYLISKEFKDKEVKLITDYPELFTLDNLTWVKPKDHNNSLFERNSLAISPTLTWYHIKYIKSSNHFIGYFLSNKFISNFTQLDFSYQPKNEHYLSKIFPILDALLIKYDIDNFLYPRLNFTAPSPNILNSLKPYIVVAPYSNWKERQYPKDRFIDLILVLIVKYNIVLIGSNNKDEVELNKSIYKEIVSHETKSHSIVDLSGKTTLYEVIYIIQNAEQYYGNDSGTTNIAFLESKDVTAFFGSVLPQNRVPLNKKLQQNIKTYHRSDLCDLYPCYDGYNKPQCNNLTEEHNCQCLDFDIELITPPSKYKNKYKNK